MCFGTRGVVLGKSRDVVRVQDPGVVYNMGGKGKGGVGGKRGYIYSSSGAFLVQHVRYDTFDSYPVFCWLTNTTRSSLHLALPLGTSYMTSLERRCSTRGEDSLQRQALLLHHIPLLLLRRHASQSKQSGSRVVPMWNDPTRLPTHLAVENAHAIAVMG